MRRVWLLLSCGALAIGLAALALTVWLWVGDWPKQTKQTLDHLRSVARNTGRPPDLLIASATRRESISLAGTWEAVIDPYARAELLGMAPLGREPRHPSDLGEFSFAKGLTLEVPGDWNSQDPRLFYYQGVVWYAHRFDAHPETGRRHFLYFGAANYRAAVYLNGLLLGEHEGGFTPFDFEVTGELRSGENLLVVKVDNRHEPDDVPTPTTDWHNYGGLTREVLLVSVPEVFVREFELRLGASGEALTGFVQLDGTPLPDEVVVEVPELGVALRGVPDATGRAGVAGAARPERWSPERPRLYRVEVRAGADRVDDEIGFRIVAVDGARILLNGEPVFLRGISLHEEVPVGEGRPHTREQAETVLGWAKQLGCNFVRLAHYPHHEEQLRAADRMGLLVWEEVPVYWNLQFGNPVTRERTRRQLRELITRDRNRAAVVLWSVGNETPRGADRDAFMAEMVDHVRALDPSRLVTAALLTGAESLRPFFLESYLPALLGWRRDVWEFPIDDPLGELLDVTAVNEYFGWYYAAAFAAVAPVSSFRARRVMLDNLPRIRFETGQGKPLIASELGAGALAGWHAPAEELVAYSEEYQALVYEKQIEMLRAQTTLAGMSPWVLRDFRSPLRLYQGVQDHWNRKGLISDRGERKLAFYVLRAHYEERARDAAAARD